MHDAVLLLSITSIKIYPLNKIGVFKLQSRVKGNPIAFLTRKHVDCFTNLHNSASPEGVDVFR